MITKRSRTTETVVYIVLWIIVAGLFLLGSMRKRAQLSVPLIDMSVMTSILRTIFPLFILFLVNNNILIPRLLLKNRWKMYFSATAIAVVILWIYQYFDFIYLINSMPPDVHPAPHPILKPLLPMPVLLDFTYALLVVGGNLAIALMFQRFDDKLEKESLMKSNAENQLAYLKAQINPHFYMNMLNNIHGMIDVDTAKAQKMLIDMSHLMRYMLYDSSKPLISLADEIDFLDKYLNLMRLRYPADKVAVTSEFPPGDLTCNISLPPLLFLVFIENAFKHGISYRESSYISVSIGVSSGRLRFECINSTHQNRMAKPDSISSGIGLKNIRQRLQLLYGDKMYLTIKEDRAAYIVNLTLPVNDTENSDNR